MESFTTDGFLQTVYHLIRQSAPGDYIILLESQLRNHPSSRFTYFALAPDIMILARGDRVEIKHTSSGSTEKRTNLNPWEVLKAVRKQYPGWYFGYFGYDLKNHIEALESKNKDVTEIPDMVFFRPSKLLIYDHKRRSIHLSKGFENERTGGSRIEKSASFIRPEINHLKWMTDKNVYIDKIKLAQERIREGDFYEINLSHVLHGSLQGDPFDLYHSMKQKGNVPFGAFLKMPPFSICSASPERFLCRKGNRVFSQPIKGTAPRFSDPARDLAVKNELRRSEKERAENLMIVDLVRHDLSKVSDPGSIRVPELYKLYTFETVHQLISTVEGTVSNQMDSVDILKACFPMGSMTGAPKISAMKTIEDLEDYKRGIYSGAIGYIDPEGDFDFNVVIRTAIIKGNKLFYPAGGAITSDSVPEKELEETFVKIRALTSIMEPGRKLK